MKTGLAPSLMHFLAHSRDSALPLPFEAPHEESLIQPTIEPAEAIDAAKTVTLRNFAITRISLFYGLSDVTDIASSRPIREGAYRYRRPRTRTKLLKQDPYLRRLRAMR